MAMVSTPAEGCCLRARGASIPFEMIDPSITLEEADRWEKLWSELFLKGQKVQKDVD